MKKLMTILLMLAAAAMLTGCVQMNSTTEIKKDGSGTMDMTITMSQVLVDVINEDGAGDEMEELGSMMKLEKKDLEKKVKGHGVKIKKFKKGQINGKEGIEVSVEFDNLEGLSYAMNQIGGDGGSGGMAIFDLGDGKYALGSYDYGWPAVEAEEDEGDDMDSMDDMDPEKMQKQMEMMGKLMGAMGELEVSMQITVPGDIIESNAHKTEGRNNIWTINSGNMMTAGGDMEPEIVFSSKGLKIKDVKQP